MGKEEKTGMAMLEVDLPAVEWTKEELSHTMYIGRVMAMLVTLIVVVVAMTSMTFSATTSVSVMTTWHRVLDY